MCSVIIEKGKNTSSLTNPLAACCVPFHGNRSVNNTCNDNLMLGNPDICSSDDPADRPLARDPSGRLEDGQMSYDDG